MLSDARSTLQAELQERGPVSVPPEGSLNGILARAELPTNDVTPELQAEFAREE